MEPKHTLLSNVRVAPQNAILALKMLLEGCGVRATSRLTGLEKKTVLKLLRKAGEKAEKLLDTKVRGVRRHARGEGDSHLFYCSVTNKTRLSPIQ